MEVLKLAAFSHEGKGGNPAGVAFCEAMPPDEEMLRIAKAVGYSETAFLVRRGEAWRVRYFAPGMEVPFCGHATLALGAALGERFGEGEYTLVLNDGPIRVKAARTANGLTATLHSPGTSSREAPEDLIDEVLSNFGLRREALDPAFPVRIASAGATHLILVLRERRTLAAMTYRFEETRALMLDQGLVTVSLLWLGADGIFHARNAFAAGGVYEDPATGAAAAALAGYLRDIRWQGGNAFTILQGEDMGVPSRLRVEFGPEPGSSVAVSGETRPLG